MREHARATGLSNTIIVNTCAVTAEAERQARQAIRRARRDRPNARIVVTGCSAQISPDTYAAMPEVDRVLGNAEKLERRSFEPGDSETVRVNDIMAARETANHLIEGFDGRARAFIQVQNGCDHRCTFCIIPFGRGNSRSVPIGEISRQVQTLVAGGFHEIVLSGVDIASYGPDLPGRPTLGQMVRRVLAAAPQLARLRLSSLDPAAIDDDLLQLIAGEPRLMPHLHLSLQAGDDVILKRMKRRHGRGQAVAVADTLRQLRPDVVLGADLIAGFPTETEAMFANTLGLVEDCGLTYLHVFPYSPRPETPAARMPQVPRPEAKERAARLRAAGQAALSGYLNSETGSERSVLIERDGFGRTEYFTPVLVAGATPGSPLPVRITGRADDKLVGVVEQRSAA
jgi:threonylcarbamoyladenosine tRNA methylthiotransferase MtaB